MTGLGATLVRAGRRLLSSLPALFGVLVFTFLLMRVLPGDPAVFFASGPNAGKEEIEQIRKQMGLNKSVPEQLVFYLSDIGHGNLGRSMMTGQPVLKDLLFAAKELGLELNFRVLPPQETATAPRRLKSVVTLIGHDRISTSAISRIAEVIAECG